MQTNRGENSFVSLEDAQTAPFPLLSPSPTPIPLSEAIALSKLNAKFFVSSDLTFDVPGSEQNSFSGLSNAFRYNTSLAFMLASGVEKADLS